MAESNIFASLLAGVQRHDPQWYGPHESGRYVLFADVVAALATAAPADLAETASDLLPTLRKGPGYVYGFVDTDNRPADMIAALLARIAAQEVQIKGLQNDNEALIAARDMLGRQWARDAEALAAERAKTAKLQSLVIRAQKIIDPCFPQRSLDWQNDARAALTETFK